GRWPDLEWLSRRRTRIGKKRKRCIAHDRQTNRREGPPVMTGHPEAANRLAMLRRRIADIGAPSIGRIARGETAHNAVARHFSDDGRSGDREAQSIAVDDR